MTVTNPRGLGTGAQQALPGNLGLTDPAAWQPGGGGLLLSSIDPAACSSSIACGSGFIYLAKLWVPSTVTIANLIVQIVTAGSGLTAAQNLAGIYDSSGNLVAQTADQSAVWNSAGFKTMALTAQGAFTLTLTGGAGVFFWAAMLGKGTTPAKPSTTPVSTVPMNPGRGLPYVATVPGAQHRVAFESAGGRTTLLSLNALTLTDNAFGQVIWFGVT